MKLIEKIAAGFMSNDPIKNEQIIKSKANRVADILRARAARNGTGYDKTKNYINGKTNQELSRELSNKARAFQLSNANRTITTNGKTYDVLRNVDDVNSSNGLSQDYNNLAGKMNNRALSAGSIGSRLSTREDYIRNRITQNTKGGFISNLSRYAVTGNDNPHLVRRDIREMAKEKIRQNKLKLGLGALAAGGLGMGVYGLMNGFSGDEINPEVLNNQQIQDSINQRIQDGVNQRIQDSMNQQIPRDYKDMILPAAVLGGAGMLAYGNRRKLDEIRNPYS